MSGKAKREWEPTDEQVRELLRASGNVSIWRRLQEHLSQTSLADGALAGTGTAAAIACAGFAIYMSAHPRPEFNGLEHLMIFAQPSYRENPPVAQADTLEDHPAIDYSATGTIHPDTGRLDAPAQARFSEPIISAYVLHYVQDGEALIVGKDDAVYRVMIGTQVPGGGRVLAIEERHGQWVVVTTRGLIVSR